MSTRTVHLIDGPCMGNVMYISGDLTVLTMAYFDEDHVNYSLRMYECDLERFRPKKIDYKISYYATSRICPYRVKTLYVGAVGEPPKDLPRLLEEDFWKSPWELFKAKSFLEDFDQWIAESIYRNMGVMIWKGRVIRDV